MRMARAAGIDVPPCRLLELGPGVGDAFVVRRFDRPGPSQRLHMLSAAGALDVDFRTAVADYGQLLRLTQFVCGGDQRQVLAMLRLAAFNVAAVNDDDHLKNASFLMHPDGAWRLAPGYDLTYAPSPSGERATTVAGTGKAVGRSDFERMASDVGIRPRDLNPIIEEVLVATSELEHHLAEAGCAGAVARVAVAAVGEASRRLE